VAIPYTYKGMKHQIKSKSVGLWVVVMHDGSRGRGSMVKVELLRAVVLHDLLLLVCEKGLDNLKEG